MPSHILRRTCLVLIGVFAFLGGPVHAENRAAADALLAVAEIERFLLDESRFRYEALAARRAAIDGNVELLHESLDAAVREEEFPDPQRLIQLAGQLESAEADRVALLAVERMLVDRIGQHLQRLELIERQIDGLEAPEENEGTLTGAWDLVLMPARQRGTALLRQTGALVNGTYRLEGGWSGSLQGTLVNRKVFLVRIDSKLGKSMELEGYLSDDGKRIRGTWLDYELAGGDGATGQWTALRQNDSD